MSASTSSFDALTGWRYPRTRPSLPESHASVRVPRRLAGAIVGLNGWLLLGTFRGWLA